MQAYLEQFYRDLSGWKGSLVKVEHVQNPHAKEYLHKLARAGFIERVTWGWYWIPEKTDDFLNFILAFGQSFPDRTDFRASIQERLPCSVTVCNPQADFLMTG